MSEVQFHQTRMGQRFYEHTMPELVRQLTRMNDLLKKIADRSDNAIPAMKTVDGIGPDCKLSGKPNST